MSPQPWLQHCLTPTGLPSIFGIFPKPQSTPTGAAHSLFAALAAGLLAAALHKRLRVSSLTAAVAVGAATASHGVLDMMTDSGKPVAYLWPLSSVRLWADWRPIHSSPVHLQSLVAGILTRLQTEAWQLIVPMFALALAVRAAPIALTQEASANPSQCKDSSAGFCRAADGRVFPTEIFNPGAIPSTRTTIHYL